MSDDRITIWDDLGRPVEIDRRDWEERILPAILEDAWDEPEELYHRLAAALEAGCAGCVDRAVGRLVELEGLSERAAVMGAAVALQVGDPDRGERFLRGFLEDHSPTGIVLTNLAKVQAERGARAEAEALLRRALELDPNQENGLEWWGAMRYERGGEEGLVAAMSEIAGVPGSWRPQLWIARHHLENGRPEEALELYASVLDRCLQCADALTMISGDLGSAGLVEEVVALALPRYETEVHGPYAGMNLIRALTETERLEEARDVLRQVQGLFAPHVAEELAELEREVLGRTDPPPVEARPTRIVWLDGPVWAHGSPELEGLLPIAPPASERIAFLSLADMTRDEPRRRVERVTAFGHFARSLPLWLAEVVRFQTDARTSTLIPVSPGVGPVLPAEPWNLPWLLGGCAEEDVPELIVHGAIRPGVGGTELELIVYDCAESRELTRLGIELDGGLYEGVGFLASELVDVLERAGRVRWRRRRGVFQTPAPEQAEAYVVTLGHFLVQVLAWNDLVDPQRLVNERGLLASYFELAESMPEAVVPELMAVRAVLIAQACGSPVAGQFLAPVQRLLDAAGEHSPLAVLGPAVERAWPG